MAVAPGMQLETRAGQMSAFHRQIAFLVAAAALAVVGPGCSLNPQPLPPGAEPGDSGGSATIAYDATAGSPNPGGDAGGQFAGDAASGSADSGSTGSPPVDGASDGASDAATDGEGEGASTTDGGTEE